MTTQDAFIKVWNHLLTQQKKSADPDRIGFCMYRAPDGCQCAIGPFIPDELYDPAMENNNIYALIDKFPALAPIFEGISLLVLDRMQSIHDHYLVDDWRPELVRLALEYGWEVPDA